MIEKVVLDSRIKDLVDEVYEYVEDKPFNEVLMYMAKLGKDVQATEDPTAYMKLVVLTMIVKG